ncbi:MAG: MarR family transcriptional regulator [Methylophilaceae bacterium]|nr:MAG: MarR family transcriptional regulator [Methylophilaceae bacterium]
MAFMAKKYSELKACACAVLRQSSRLITQYYEDAYRVHHITSAQFNIMSVLANTGSITVSQLAETLLQDRTGLTRNLKIMNNNGWVSIQQGDDRRVKNVELTNQGFEKLDLVIPLWREVQRKVSEEVLNLDQLQQDRAKLRKLTQT